MRFILLYIRSIRGFIRDGGMMLAGSLSFFSMMAMVPFCLFLLSVLAYFMGTDPGFVKFFSERFAGLFPKAAGNMAVDIRNLITSRGMGGVGLGLYAVLSFKFYWALHKSINTVFKAHKKRMFIVTVLVSFLVVSLMVGFLFLSFTLASAVSFLNDLAREVQWLQISGFKKFIFRYVLSPVVSVLMLLTIYTLMPMKKIHVRNAFKGALATALMLEVAKHLFTLYVSHVLSLDTVYGSLSSFVVFMLWVYYSCAIFLIGCELVSNLEGVGGAPLAANVVRLTRRR